MRAIGILIVIVLAVLVVGLLAGWFSISKESTPEETRIGLSVHEDEVEEDLDAAREKVKDIGEGIKDAVRKDPPETVPTDDVEDPLAGTLQSVDSLARRLTLRINGDELESMELEPSTVVELDGEPATLESLLPGDRVVIQWKELPGGGRVRTVVATREG